MVETESIQIAVIFESHYIYLDLYLLFGIEVLGYNVVRFTFRELIDINIVN